MISQFSQRSKAVKKVVRVPSVNYDGSALLTNLSEALHQYQFVGNKAKGRISKRVFQENKARQIFHKMNISYPLIRTRAFCVITDELLIAKLNVHGVDTNCLYFLASYLEKKRKQRTKVIGSNSYFDNIFSGFRSMLGPVLFNMYISDLFFLFGDWDLAEVATGSVL